MISEKMNTMDIVSDVLRVAQLILGNDLSPHCKLKHLEMRSEDSKRYHMDIVSPDRQIVASECHITQCACRVTGVRSR